MTTPPAEVVRRASPRSSRHAEAAQLGLTTYRLGRPRLCGCVHRSEVRGDLVAAGRE